MGIKRKSLRPLLQIKHDWGAYFRAFHERHGGDPVEYHGRILYSDGWMYSSVDHAGEEFPPPDDPARWTELMVWYWRHHLARINTELTMLDGILRSIKQVKSTRSMPIMHRSYVFDEELGRKTWKSEPLDEKLYEGRRDRLLTAKQDCENRLAVLCDENYDPRADELINEHIINPPEWAAVE